MTPRGIGTTASLPWLSTAQTITGTEAIHRNRVLVEASRRGSRAVTPWDTSQIAKQPRDSWPGLLLGHYSAKGPVSRILSCAVIPLGAALPRTLISDLPGGFGNCSSRLSASGRYAAPPGSWRQLPSLFGLAPCGVYPASGFTAGAVRSYRTFSPLPRRDWPSRRT
jgi:hypothetical protein